MVARTMSLHRLCVYVSTVILLCGLVGCHGGGRSAATSAGGAASLVSPSQAGLRGDLNDNGMPDITDAVGILRIIVGLDPANALADCDCDGLTGITDAIALLRCLVGLAPWPIHCGECVPGEDCIGPDGQTLLWVPGGTFMMGNAQGAVDEQPVHQVTVDGFWIGRCEVTNAGYRIFCNATGRAFPSQSDQPDDHPVTCVSFNDAQAYCAYYGYALPTEAQWEYAAAGAAAPTWPWGNEWDAQKCCNGSNTGPGGTTFPVGSFPTGASWSGALDMAGNVFEWCADWYAGDYYSVSPELNPTGPVAGSTRVFRGGQWYLPADFCRCARRGSDAPDRVTAFSGFRVAYTGG